MDINKVKSSIKDENTKPTSIIVPQKYGDFIPGQLINFSQTRTLYNGTLRDTSILVGKTKENHTVLVLAEDYRAHMIEIDRELNAVDLAILKSSLKEDESLEEIVRKIGGKGLVFAKNEYGSISWTHNYKNDITIFRTDDTSVYIDIGDGQDVVFIFPKGFEDSFFRDATADEIAKRLTDDCVETRGSSILFREGQRPAFGKYISLTHDKDQESLTVRFDGTFYKNISLNEIRRLSNQATIDLKSHSGYFAEESASADSHIIGDTKFIQNFNKDLEH